MRRETGRLLVAGAVCATAAVGCTSPIEGRAQPVVSPESCKSFLSETGGYPIDDVRGLATAIRACYDNMPQENRVQIGAHMVGVSFKAKDGRQERFAVESEVGPSDVSFVDKTKRVQFDLLRSTGVETPSYDYNVSLNTEGAHWFVPGLSIDAAFKDPQGQPTVSVSKGGSGMGAVIPGVDVVTCVRHQVAGQLADVVSISGGAIPIVLSEPVIACQAD